MSTDPKEHITVRYDAIRFSEAHFAEFLAPYLEAGWKVESIKSRTHDNGRDILLVRNRLPRP